MDIFAGELTADNTDLSGCRKYDGDGARTVGVAAAATCGFGATCRIGQWITIVGYRDTLMDFTFGEIIIGARTTVGFAFVCAGCI